MTKKLVIHLYAVKISLSLLIWQNSHYHIQSYTWIMYRNIRNRIQWLFSRTRLIQFKMSIERARSHQTTQGGKLETRRSSRRRCSCCHIVSPLISNWKMVSKEVRKALAKRYCAECYVHMSTLSLCLEGTQSQARGPRNHKQPRCIDRTTREGAAGVF